VPCAAGISASCETGLRDLERAGVKVLRDSSLSPGDAARDLMASMALREGCEKLLFVEPHVGFHAQDALRLLARHEPVLAGVSESIPGAGRNVFAPEVPHVIFGPRAIGAYPLRSVPTGFLRVLARSLRAMTAELKLPLRTSPKGINYWPFFSAPGCPSTGDNCACQIRGSGFSERLALMGVTPLADTSIKLWLDCSQSRP
jgi:hypothetical protein